MRHKLKRLSILLICTLLVALLLPVTSFAQGKIITDHPSKLTISYIDDEKPIKNARFRIFKVADIDEYADLTLTADFEKYKDTIQGLSDLNSLKQDEWLTLASTLRAYVLSDNLSSTNEGKTDANGNLVFSNLSVGVYLVIGNRATTDDFYTYTSVPFMVYFPDRDSLNNDWKYEITAAPKFSKEYYPPEERDDFITRKVVKNWDDEGYESIRPKDLKVQLLCDGDLYDVQILNKENAWRYAWDNLPQDHEWLIMEIVPTDYTVKIEQVGITTVLTNKYTVPVVISDPGVQKKISGDLPNKTSTFHFVMEADKPDYPMPEGSSGGRKEITIDGAGSQEFGILTFTKPGDYGYRVYEIAGNEKGYIYDNEIYTLTFHVAMKDGVLNIVREIKNSAGTQKNVMEFNNKYKEEELPQTGVLWWPLPILLFLGAAFIVTGAVFCRKQNEK